MNRARIYAEYLKTHDVPEMASRKVNTASYLTDHFAYLAFRIGNSIGDHLDMSIEIVFLEEIARKHGLILNTTEHAELHTRGTGVKDLDDLINGAVLFENIKNNKKNYSESLMRITDFIRGEFNRIVQE